MASAGNGTPQHIFGEIFKMMAGVDLTHVPYRGGAPATTDLLGGQVQVIFTSGIDRTHQSRQAATVGGDNHGSS
jgi:tripartite-type tricarboxylate transporter receptor subunit TctC